MSVSERLNELLDKRNDLKQELWDLDNPAGKKQKLFARVDKLANKQSDRAKDLYEAAKEELTKCEERIAKLEKDLDTTVAEINRLENDPTDHIEEQTSLMVTKFYEFVKENYGTLSYNITSTYHIKNCDPKFVNYESCPMLVSIVSESGSFFAQEKDRYFSRELTGYVNDRCYTVTPPTTPWYRDFLNAFYKRLREKLVEDNPFKETFMITFENYEFTLELV